jgi:hypothetical protein
MDLYRMDYPAVDGRVICQGHTDACAKHGHAVWSINGVVQDRCPRCDTLTTPDVVVAYSAETFPCPDDECCEAFTTRGLWEEHKRTAHPRPKLNPLLGSEDMAHNFGLFVANLSADDIIDTVAVGAINVRVSQELRDAKARNEIDINEETLRWMAYCHAWDVVFS